jgi:dihydrodipicolinate synthase/N-acetylneuraminate lyase
MTLPGQSEWRGIFPAICTPFTERGEVDFDAQRRIIRFALEAGVHGLVLFGLAGEVLKLSAVERVRLLETILDEVDGRVPVFAGVGAESVLVSCELARHAQAAGVSCIVLPAPRSGAVAGRNLVDYFVRAADSVVVPVMIQDAPVHLGISLGPGLVEKVAARAGNVRLVKLEAGPHELARWIEELGPEFSIWGGDGGVYQLDCLRIGAAGIIPGVDLVDVLVEVYELERNGEHAAADVLFGSALPMLVFEMQHSIDHYNACAKQVLRWRGVELHGSLREPAAALGEVSLSLLERHAAALKLGDERAVAAG